MKTIVTVILVVLVIAAITGVGLAAKPENPPSPGGNDPLSALWNTVNALQTAMNGLQANDTVHDTQIWTLQNNATSQEERLNTLEADVAADDTALSNLAAIASAQESEIADLQDQIDTIPTGGTVHIGDWQVKQPGTFYTAATDGFVIGYAVNTAPSPNRIIEYISIPGVPAYKIHSTIDPDEMVSFNLPIKAGSTWVVYQNSWSEGEAPLDFFLYWVPLEA